MIIKIRRKKKSIRYVFYEERNIYNAYYSFGSKTNEGNAYEKKAGPSLRKKLIHQSSVTSDIERHLHGSSSESLGAIGGKHFLICNI